MGRAQKYSDDQILEALEKCGGVVLHAAQALGAARASIQRRIDNSKELTQQLKDLREVNIDIAESKLMELIRKGQPAAVIFYLKCVAKHRGYVERAEVTGKDGADLVLPIANVPRATSMEEWLEQNRKEAAA
jgi:hypothetical protein|tara:strand:+ start:1559 stop:1954 length:396 start_codon:yes stop_codon:yes gene_type:complete